MKSIQLANVLIKILGLSVCLYAIPSCVSSIIVAVVAHPQSALNESMRISSYAIGAGVQAIVGIAIIVKSKTVAGWMFKNDAE